MADLFDLSIARARKETGLNLVSQHNSTYLYEARLAAERIARTMGQCTSDDVQAVLPRPSYVHPNVMGAIFKGSRWKCAGFKKSHRVSGHGRRISIWELNDV